MKYLLLLVLLVGTVVSDYDEEPEIEPGDPEDIGPDAPQVTPPTDSEDAKEAVQEISLDVRIRQMLEHFKQDDPRGLPGLPIPDPMPIPDFEGQFTMAKIKFSEALLHGLSQFRIEHVRTDLKDMKVWVGFSFESLQVLGRYRMGSWLSTSSGDFNVTLLDVNAQGFVGLAVDTEGAIQASNITIDLRFRDIAMNFDNLGFFGSLFQGIINSVGTFIFDSIKPLILGKVNEQIKTTINTQMRNLKQQLPDSVPPLDLAIAMAGKKIREMGFDPFNVPRSNFTIQSGIVVIVPSGVVEGLSTVHRSGNIDVSYENGSLIVSVQAATQRLYGSFDWLLDFKVYSPKGKISLEIDGLDIKIGLKQPVNVQKKPRLEVLKLKLGNIQARSTGTGSMDYLIEFTINFLVNGFRGVILKSMEKPVINIIQAELDKLDVEAIIEAQLDNLNKI